MRKLSLPLLLATCLTLTLSLGCNSSDGPARYPLQGNVTFRGKPLPKGMIVFHPDGNSGNQGPGATAEISEGKYQTLEGMGTIGGKHSVEITGFDGVAYHDGHQLNPMGQLLFMSYREMVDLPQAPSTHDFTVPEPGR